MLPWYPSKHGKNFKSGKHSFLRDLAWYVPQTHCFCYCNGWKWRQTNLNHFRLAGGRGSIWKDVMMLLWYRVFLGTIDWKYSIKSKLMSEFFPLGNTGRVRSLWRQQWIMSCHCFYLALCRVLESETWNDGRERWAPLYKVDTWEKDMSRLLHRHGGL